MQAPSQMTAAFLTPDDPRWLNALSEAKHDIFHLPGYLKAWTVAKGGEPLLYSLDADTFGMLVPLIKRPLAGFGEGYQGFHDATSPYGYGGPIYWGACQPDPAGGNE